MRPFRIALWIPCVLGALAAHFLALEALTLSSGPGRSHSTRDEFPCFRLRPNVKSVARDVPVLHSAEEEWEQLIKQTDQLRAQLSKSGPRAEWEGEYDLGTGLGGEVLLLASGRFVRHQSYCGFSEGDSGVAGLRDGILELETRIRPSPYPPGYRESDLERRSRDEMLTRWLVPTPCAGGHYLIRPNEMLEFVDGVASGEVARWEFGSRYRHRRGDPIPAQGTRVVIPDGYRRTWEALPHFRVLRRIEPTSQMPTQIEMESDGSRKDPDRQATFYWDGDPHGHTRAIELSRTGKRMLAYLPREQALSPELIQVGCTFTSLPNLR